MRRLAVIAAEDRIEAVLGAPTATTPPPGMSWCGVWADLRAHGHVGRLLPAGAVFCAELTERWGRLVACTPEFAAWWRARPTATAPSPSFFLELGHAD